MTPIYGVTVKTEKKKTFFDNQKVAFSKKKNHFLTTKNEQKSYSVCKKKFHFTIPQH